MPRCSTCAAQREQGATLPPYAEPALLHMVEHCNLLLKTTDLLAGMGWHWIGTVSDLAIFDPVVDKELAGALPSRAGIDVVSAVLAANLLQRGHLIEKRC